MVCPSQTHFPHYEAKKSFATLITDVVSSVLSVLITINQPGEKKNVCSQKSKTKNIYIFSKFLKGPGTYSQIFLRSSHVNPLVRVALTIPSLSLSNE
jgi:hypothetical protein